MMRYSKILPCLFFFMSLISCRNAANETIQTNVIISDSAGNQTGKSANLLFGIPTDSFTLITGHIKPNGYLSKILVDHGVEIKDIDRLVKNSKSVFDVRDIRAGHDYTLLCDNDSSAKLKYMIYEEDPATFYVFSFNDSLNITRFKKHVTSIIKYSSGVIETSLWESMINNGLHPTLAEALSGIFAWSVDFFGLQKGDSFKVIYEERFIDDRSLGTGKIYAAQFTWGGKTTSAIPFIQEGKESFFDEDGNSLRKAFLKAPLQFSRISSRYSSGRLHPILRIVRPHFGVDYAAPAGTPVHAIGDGKIVYAGTDNESGRMVKIVHNSVYSTAYLHLSSFANGIYPGAFVKQNDIIGYVGMSGLATGPHLDFRFYQNGYPVDPLKVDAPPVEPVSAENKVEFEKVKFVMLSLLDTFHIMKADSAKAVQ